MRLNAYEVVSRVWVLDTAIRPIQLKVGGLRYSMRRDEALELASQIVAAVDEFETQRVAGGAPDPDGASG